MNTSKALNIVLWWLAVDRNIFVIESTNWHNHNTPSRFWLNMKIYSVANWNVIKCLNWQSWHHWMFVFNFYICPTSKEMARGQKTEIFSGRLFRKIFFLRVSCFCCLHEFSNKRCKSGSCKMSVNLYCLWFASCVFIF